MHPTSRPCCTCSCPVPSALLPLSPLGTQTEFHTMHSVDLGAKQQNLISKSLRGRQHLRVVRTDQVLHKFLQLVPVHLGQRFRDGQAQLHLAGLPDAVQGQGHHVGTVEDVPVVAGTAH